MSHRIFYELGDLGMPVGIVYCINTKKKRLEFFKIH